MGRKGVSKRKPAKTKSKPFSSSSVNTGLTSVVLATESQPVKSIDSRKAVPSINGGVNPSAARMKNTRKG